VAWSYAGFMAVLFVAGAPGLVRVFAHGFGAGDQAVLPLAQALLRLAALYTLADAAQIVFSGALRGAGDTKWVMIISGILHWVMAVGAFLLIRVLALPPVGVWIFFIGFVISLGIAMYLRFRHSGWERLHLVEEPTQ
jgi:MATE family multidrug resistance protein